MSAEVSSPIPGSDLLVTTCGAEFPRTLNFPGLCKMYQFGGQGKLEMFSGNIFWS